MAPSQQHNVDILFCDLRMPEMDSMALVGFQDVIILSSAVEGDVVEAVLRMRAAYGLQVLGCTENPQLRSSSSGLSKAGHPGRSQLGRRRCTGADSMSCAKRSSKIKCCFGISPR